MMGKMKLLVVTVFFVSFAVFACDKVSQAGPKEVLNSYLDAHLNGRSEEAYSHISSEDKAVKDLQTYIKENDISKDIPFSKYLFSKCSYKILNLDQEGENEASAEVEITMPDLSAMFGSIMMAAFTARPGSDAEKQIKKKLAKKFENGDVPLTTMKNNVHLLKENDGWKVFMDWKTAKIEEEKRTKIQTLLTEAKKLKKAKKLNGAAQKYEEVLDLDSEMVEAKAGLEKTRSEIKSFNEKQDYIKQVELRNFKVGIGENYGQRKKGVFGTIINHGKRTLDQVQITVYFLDKNGTIIGEKDIHPVLVTKYSIRDNKPLKPNYVKDFGYSIEDDAPSLWGGKIKAKISDIEFAD
jgi:hypothetical protein